MTQDTSLSSDRYRGHTLAQQLASAQAWWREAGVDLDFADEATNWIASEETPNKSETADRGAPPEPKEATPPRITQQRANWPENLGDFAAWWLSEPTLGDGDLSSRVAPRGRANANLMILVTDPEAEDADRLLTGAKGRFLQNFLSAAGLAEEQVYFASVLPRHTPMADWDELARDGIGELTRHHIALVSPKRLITFGGHISPLLGHDPAQSPNFKLDINHGGGELSVLACWDLAALLLRGKARSGFWQRWLDWTVSNA